MSVEYRRYTIPRPNSFLPEIGQVQSFLEQVSAHWSFYRGWVGQRGEGRKIKREGTTVAGMVGILAELWSTGIRARFPFRWPGREYAYDLEIHVSPRDYVYHTSETVSWFESADCVKCAHPLAYEAAGDVFQEWRIYAACPRCGTLFDPSSLSATYTHWLTGAPSPLSGGATYCFALILDNVPDEEWEQFAADPSFAELTRQAFGCEFYEVVDIT